MDYEKQEQEEAGAIYWELVGRYKKDKGEKKCVLVEYSDLHQLSSLNDFLNQAKRYKKKSFHIKTIKQIDSDKIISYAFGIQSMKRKKDDVIVRDMTGLFKITFSDKSIMYYAKWMTGGGKTRAVDGMFVTERHVWANFLQMINKEVKKKSKPKVGVYRIFSDGMGNIQYQKKKELLETPIVHPSIPDIINDMEFYYANVELFTRHKMAGMRKIMLIGEPGTGKSSLCFKLAKKYASTKSIVFATNINDVAQHTILCAKYNISTFVILEDAESSLQNAGSEVFNFLDGIDQPRNLAGAFIIMTTNHPQKIEPRILKRPGRVDNIITFGALKDGDALECARIYFEDFLPITRFKNGKKVKLSSKKDKEMTKLEMELMNIVNGMTGAQIKEVSNASASFAVSKQRDVDIEIIKEVKDRMKENLKKAEDYAKEYSLEGDRQSLGFKTQNSITIGMPIKKSTII